MPKIDQLRDKIKQASNHYFNLGVALVTDDEFDTMLAELRRNDPNDPLLDAVGTIPTLDKVEHSYPMGSLDNIDVSVPAEMKTYINSCKKRIDSENSKALTFNVSPKMDGSSLALYYEKGELVRALTRGNGKVGQDITAKAHLFQGVPTTLSEPIDVVVRGEAVMLRSVFEDYVKRSEREGVSNPRNVGNGIIVRKSCKGAGLICFYAFNLLSVDESVTNIKTVEGLFSKLGHLGFKAPMTSVIEAKELLNLTAIDTKLWDSSYPYDFDIDGLVVRVNDLDQQSLINEGGDELRPRSDRALKYNSKKAETTILGVTVTVGHTGKITPTLQVDPVEIGGITNSNILIYNYEEATRLGLGIGDKIRIVLAGDIIPKVLSVTDKSPTSEPIVPPVGCPSCGKEITKKLLKDDKESVDLFCLNPDCSGIHFHKIKKFIGNSKRGMGILGIGEGLISYLIDSGVVSTVSDLYDLYPEQVAVMPLGVGKVGDSRSEKIVSAIQESKKNEIWQVIGALGIDGLGRSRAKTIMEAGHKLDQKAPLFNNLSDWVSVGRATWMNFVCSDLPEEMMTLAFDQLRQLKPVIEELAMKNVGIAVDFETETSVDPASQPFAGLNFCFTGTRQFVDVVESLGGKVASGVSKKTDYLVQKDSSKVTGKSKKAVVCGTKIIDLDDLERLIESAK